MAPCASDHVGSSSVGLPEASKPVLKAERRAIFVPKAQRRHFTARFSTSTRLCCHTAAVSSLPSSRPPCRAEQALRFCICFFDSQKRCKSSRLAAHRTHRPQEPTLGRGPAAGKTFRTRVRSDHPPGLLAATHAAAGPYVMGAQAYHRTVPGHARLVWLWGRCTCVHTWTVVWMGERGCSVQRACPRGGGTASLSRVACWALAGYGWGWRCGICRADDGEYLRAL